MNPPQLSGVYGAKVASVASGVLSVLVPQVFRDQQISVNNWVGRQPVASSMGFVAFVGGDPAWPVWLGRSNVPVTSSGGSSGTDGASAYEIAVANGYTGSEEAWLATLVGPKGSPAALVCTSASRPTSPTEGMVIYETDTDKMLAYTTATTGWVPPWNMPWGVVGNATATSSQTGITTETDLTGLTLTKTLVANRRYLLSLSCNAYVSTNLDTMGSIRFYNDTTQLQELWLPTFAGLDDQQGFFAQITFTTTSASHTVKATLRRALGTGTVSLYATSTGPAELVLTDMGPSGAPA